jgi:hypothetical protein
MGVEDVGRLPAVVDDGGGFYPPIPNDPYARNPVINMNEKMMLAILDSKIKSKEDFNEYVPMLMVLIDNVARIPNIEMVIVKSLQRDMADIIELAECQGTEQIVLSMMTQMIFEIRSLVAYGGAPLIGLSGVSAIITTRQQQDQKVTYPQQLPEQRKKIFGVF